MTAEGNPVQEDPVITAKAGANGTITPSGSVTVKAGADQAFDHRSRTAGYTVSKVLVDGTDVGAVTSYTFKNVTANHTIEAGFCEGGSKADQSLRRRCRGNSTTTTRCCGRWQTA